MKYVLYVIGVAVATMILVYIGYIKERVLPVELTDRLYRKCSFAVLKHLKYNEHAAITDIQKCIKDIQASVPWSRKKITVTNPYQFAGVVMDGLYKEGKIGIKYKGNSKLYYLSIKESK